MDKLTKWRVEEIKGSFLLCGFTVDDGERFLAGASIHTSKIVGVDVNEPDRNFVFYTRSGSVYVCPFEDIRWTDRFAEISGDNLERMNVSRAFVDEAVKLAHAKEGSLVDRLGKELLNGDLYLEMGAGGIINVHFKYMDAVHRISCYVHVGTFQDSFLYCQPGVVDFRHFGFSCGMVRTYHMSDSIKRLAVNNVGGRPVTIDDKAYESGTTIACITEENHREGLFSPDVFNGKSLINEDFLRAINGLD